MSPPLLVIRKVNYPKNKKCRRLLLCTKKYAASYSDVGYNFSTSLRICLNKYSALDGEKQLN